MSPRFHLVTGCSGGGKSTLLAALTARGCYTIPEPGRRIVAQELAADGAALPWVNLSAFAQRALEMARMDLAEAATCDGPVFFDRGLIDAAVALEHAGGPTMERTLGPVRHYARTVFVAPPWPEIYQQDNARQHSFPDAMAEYERLCHALPKLGYQTCLLPKCHVEDRVAFLFKQLGQSQQTPPP